MAATPDAVVRPQRGAFGRDPPLLIDAQAQRIAQKVVAAVGVLFADHVQVRLDHDPRPIGKAGGGRFAHQQVAGGVDFAGQAAAAGQCGHRRPQAGFVARAVGDGADAGKMVPQRLGGEVL